MANRGERQETTDLARDLAIPPAEPVRAAPVSVSVVPSGAAPVQRFADDLPEAYRTARRADRNEVVFIVPAGPVGQVDLLARRVNAERESLRDQWPCAIVRKVLHGPVTPAVPAPLPRTHPDVRATLTEAVMRPPAPERR